MPEAGRLNSPRSRTEAVATGEVDRYVVVGNEIVELDKPQFFSVDATYMPAFAYEVKGHAIGEARPLMNTWNQEIISDAHFVVTMGNRILWVTNEGWVWGRDFRSSGEMLPRFRLDGAPVAHNPGDHFVLTVGNWILVITNEGQVWGHTATIDNTIRDAVRLDGPPVAYNPGDHFVVTMHLRILVITTEGQVWAHDVNGFPPTIGGGFRLDGPPVAYNPGDQFVLTMDNRILVITNEGELWGHDVNAATIGPGFKLYFDP